MSDPVTNADIEDVLAQVRRLVLQGDPVEAARPVRTTLLRGPATSRPEARPDAGSRLVLTPALRVEEPARPGEDGAAPLRLHRAADAARRGAPPDALPDTPAPLLLSSPLAKAGSDGAGRAPAAEDAPAAGFPGSWRHDRSGLSLRMEEGRALRSVGTPPARDQEVGAPQRREVASGAAAGPADPASASEREPGWTSDWTLAEEIEEEPQDAIEGNPPLVFRHRALAAVDAGPAVPPLEPFERGGEAAAALDEEWLRAIVRDVVRAELQGELGERITRNLRKLVRREVFRVLESREEP